MSSLRVPIASVLLIACGSGMAQTSGPEQEVRQLIEQYNAFSAVRDVNGLMSLYHDQMDFPTLDPNALRKGIEASLQGEKAPKLEVLAVLSRGQTMGARVRTADSTDEAPQETRLLALRPQDGVMRICGVYNEAGPDAFDPKTRIYTSRKGKLSIRIPEGWTPAHTWAILAGIVPDSVYVLSPDLRSSCTLGFVQLPLKLGPDDQTSAQKGIEGDTALERRFTADYKVVEQGPTQVAGLQGYRMVTDFKIPNSSGDGRRRLRVYLSEHPMLYFFICDAMPPEGFLALAPQFESIVSSLDLDPVQGDLTRQEAVAAEQAQGTVTGRVYTSAEYNCFIAAPEGWEIRTSPNPAHLVEMQYTRGKSLARLIAAKGLKETHTLQDVFAQRLESVRQIVQDFNETSRRDVTLADTPGIESIHTFKIEALGALHVKEVTLVKDGVYYLILCQCIEPDAFAVLEKDFDRIIQSFGFTQ
ncbi:MAG: hypothetical protein KBE04_05340 [Phycisphaerae bacterium]|nr:hypothetical protein [Phycisphaerae bacterium]